MTGTSGDITAASGTFPWAASCTAALGSSPIDHLRAGYPEQSGVRPGLSRYTLPRATPYPTVLKGIAVQRNTTSPRGELCDDGSLSPPDGAVLRVRDVHKRYRARQVLRGVSLDVSPGQLVGVVGENGSGKSTLLRILAGELAPDSGGVECHGLLGYCPQEAVLNPALTVEQHLVFFGTACGQPDALGRGYELLEYLRCSKYRGERVGNLSGGTCQKVNLTLTLMRDPKLILLDEPDQALDWENYVRLWQLADAERDRGRAIVAVSHITHDAGRYDRLWRLDSGVLTDLDHVFSGDSVATS